MKPEDPGGSESGRKRSPLAFAGLGFEIVAPILLGAFGGYHLDRWLETSPWFLLAGLLLGILLGFYNFFRAVWPMVGSGEGGKR